MDSLILEADENASIATVKFGVLPCRSGNGSCVDVKWTKIIDANSRKRVDKLWLSDVTLTTGRGAVICSPTEAFRHLQS